MPHRLNTLITCDQPKTVTQMRSFIGTYKVLARVIPQAAKFLSPLDDSTCGAATGSQLIKWTDELSSAFEKAKDHLKKAHTIHMPHSSEKLWIVTDGATASWGLGATLYTTNTNDQKVLAGFFSAKLRTGQQRWLPCEIEALAIATVIKHFEPLIIQSKEQASVTDSKSCVQAVQRLRRVEFSASPRVTTFLNVIGRYNIAVAHLKGSDNTVSDFASRNAPDCQEPTCQVCRFVQETVMGAVYAFSVEDIIHGHACLPYTNRHTWEKLQQECPDLRVTAEYMKKGIPLKRKTQR